MFHRYWPALFNFDEDDDKCDVADFIPRRGKLITKPKKARAPKTYELSTLQEDETKCKGRKCECRYFFATFSQDNLKYESWKLNIIKQYDKFNREAKLRYIQQWIHFTTPKRSTKSDRTTRFPKSYFFLYPDYDGFSKRLCKDTFKMLFNFGQVSYHNLLTAVWNHRTSADLTLNLPDKCGQSQDPAWMKHFENWLLKNVPYQKSHYDVKPEDKQYISIQSLNGKTLMPKDVYVHFFLKIHWLII